MTLQDEIIELIENNEMEEAFFKIQQYQQQYGMDEFFYLAFSDILLFQGMFEEVILIITDARNDGFDNELFYERLADAYVGLEQYDEALKYLNMCSFDEDVQNSLHISFLYGQVYLHQGEYKKAINSFEDVLLEVDSEPVYYFAAIAYWKSGKTGRALEYFDRVCRKEEIAESICEFFTEEKDEEHFRKYLENIPGEEKKAYYLADFYIAMKQYHEAEQCLINILKKYDFGIFYNQLLLVYQATGQEKKLNSIERKVLKLLPDGTLDEESLLSMKIAALINLKYSETTVAKHVNEIMRQSDNKQKTFMKLAAFLCTENYFKAASKFLYDMEPAGLSEEEHLYLTRLRIYMHLFRQEFDKAYDEFQEYMKFKPLEEEFEEDYASCCMYARHYEEALKVAYPRRSSGRMAAICLYCYDMLGKTEEEFALLDQINKDLEDGKEYKDIDYVLEALDILAGRDE